MFETPLTVVGHIVNDPQRRKVGDQEFIKFRVASNSRRRTADGGWEPGNSLFITVNCWGRLVTGVGAALGKGAPVIVVGHVYTSEYEDRDGNRRSSLELRATSVVQISRASLCVSRSPGTRVRARKRQRRPQPQRGARTSPTTTTTAPATLLTLRTLRRVRTPPIAVHYHCRLSAARWCLGWSAG